MAKYKKKPVLPIYTIAIVWVIYTLVHPLYQVSDYVSVILISVVVFIVAKGVFPTIEDGPAIPPELVQHAHEQAAADQSGRPRPRRHPPQRTKRRKRRPRQLRPLPRSRRRRKRRTPGADQALLGGFP